MSSLAGMLDIFDVEQVDEHRYVGGSDGGTRQVVDGSQILAQAIVAAVKSSPGKVARSAYAVFLRTADPQRRLEFDVEVVGSGRSVATTTVQARQGERLCGVFTVMLDVPQADVVRHGAAPPRATSPQASLEVSMPLPGRQLRIDGVADPNDPAEVGPPHLDAWLHYDVVPERDELRKALIAHFTGHLSISASLRPHEGLGTSLAHISLSTAVMTISIAFHEPVTWDGWLLYAHDSVAVGAGMSHVRGQVFTEDGRLIASFTQDGLIRALDADTAARLPESARL